MQVNPALFNQTVSRVSSGFLILKSIFFLFRVTTIRLLWQVMSTIQNVQAFMRLLCESVYRLSIYTWDKSYRDLVFDPLVWISEEDAFVPRILQLN